RAIEPPIAPSPIRPRVWGRTAWKVHGARILWSPMRAGAGAAPSISRLFAATFIAVALVGLATQIATWRTARATQAAVVALAGREALQTYLSQLLAALNTSADEAASGISQALGIIADATKATGIVLYQPAYDANEWAATASRSIEARPQPVARATMRNLI